MVFLLQSDFGVFGFHCFLRPSVFRRELFYVLDKFSIWFGFPPVGVFCSFFLAIAFSLRPPVGVFYVILFFLDYSENEVR